MESFWEWFKKDINTPGTIIVLGFFAFLAVTTLIAKLRKRKAGDRFVLWEIVSAVGNWFK